MKFEYVYHSQLALNDCIKRITSLPWEFEDVWTSSSLWYKCQTISPTQLLITFTGGEFRRSRRTKYVMVFSKKEQTTVIEVRFQKEFLGLPPMTSVDEIDAFMTQKIMAKRTDKL